MKAGAAGHGQMAEFEKHMSAPTMPQYGIPPTLIRWRRREWQRFSISWTPARRGEFLLSSLAEAANGVLQPVSGRRNAIYDVPVTVA